LFITKYHGVNNVQNRKPPGIAEDYNKNCNETDIAMQTVRIAVATTDPHTVKVRKWHLAWTLCLTWEAIEKK